jgi:amphi-Trp domain-containing protein
MHCGYNRYERRPERMLEDNSDPEEREVQFEHPLPGEEVAEYFRAFTDGLESGEAITLSVGDEDAEFTPPEYLGFEAEYEKGNQREIELELKWTIQEDQIETDSE